jgi:hypothetical protein
MTDNEERQLREILDRLRSVEDRVVSVEQNVLVGNQEVFNNALYLEAILGILRGTSPATSGTIRQLGGTMAGITGTAVGGTSTFQVTWNGAMTAGAPVTWTSSDSSITLTPVSTDPTGNTVQAVDAAGDTNPSYTLTVTGTASNGTTVTATASVPLLAAPATGGTIQQLS